MNGCGLFGGVGALVLAGCATAPVPPASEALPEPGGGVWLEVEVERVESSEGRVAFALFATETSFREGQEPYRREFVPIEANRALWRLEDLAGGEYAIKAYHDRNGDRELNKNPLGAPTEPYGFSNGGRGRFGPPAWEEARFRLDRPGRQLSIVLE